MSVNETDMTYPKCAPGKGINFPSEKNYWKKFEKNNLTIALNVCMLKKKKYILLMFQNIIQIVNNKLFF